MDTRDRFPPSLGSFQNIGGFLRPKLLPSFQLWLAIYASNHNNQLGFAKYTPTYSLNLSTRKKQL